MAEQKDDFFEEFKRDVRRVLASDPLETMEESIGLFLKLPLLKPEQLAARDFKPDISELGRRVSAYQNSDGKSAIGLVVQGQALEYHQMRVLKRISPSYQKQAKASEIFKILSQLNEQQTNVLYKTGIPPETDILAYMSAVQELKEHQIEIWWKFGFPKEIGVVEYFNLLKDLDLYKTNVFNNIPVNRIRTEATLYEVIRGLHDMRIEMMDDEKMWHLQFEEDADPIVKAIIADAAYARAGIKTENRFVLIAVDEKENKVGDYVECDTKILTQKCKDVLSEYPGSHILIDENLDAKYLQKNNFDFSYLQHIVVGGDFVCSKQSKCFPYKVNGLFDCRTLSKGSITKNTVLPITKKIDFGHSIASLDVLFGSLPPGIQTIIVEPAFIRENSLHLDAAKKLVEMYPGLQITDTKGNVYGQKKEEKVKPLKAKPEEKPEAAKQMLEQKIPGKHMGVKDIIKYCRTKRKSDFAGISEDELKRLIRRVVSDQRKNDIEKKMMQLADGTPVVCIDASQIDLVCEDILAVRQEDIDREAAKSKEGGDSKTITPKNVEPVAQSNVPQPVKITKYIPRDLYKAIRASSPHKITDVLRDINDINLDPIDPKMQDQDRIHIIKDGVVTVSSKVKKDGGACLVQSVDGGISCDRKRIIWGVANGPDGELIIVGIDFCADHDPSKNSKRQIYDSARQLAFKKRIYSAKELRGYLKVEDLLGNDNNTNISCVTLLVMGIMQKKR